MTDLMQGFPPAPEGRVTLANWRRAPFNRWAFQHVRELVPSADIPSDPGAVPPSHVMPALDADIQSRTIDSRTGLPGQAR